MKKKLLVLCALGVLLGSAIVYAQQYYNFVVTVTCSTCGYNNGGDQQSKQTEQEAVEAALKNARHQRYQNRAGQYVMCRKKANDFNVSSRIVNP